MINFKAPKKYNIYKLVDKPKGPFVTKAIACLIWIYTLILRSPPLNRQAIYRIIIAGDTKLAIRHAIFHTNLSWLPIQIHGDGYFNISQDIPNAAINELIPTIKNKLKLNSFKKHAYLADLYGGLLHNYCIENGKPIHSSNPRVKLAEIEQQKHLNIIFKALESPEQITGTIESDKFSKSRLSKKDAKIALNDLKDIMQKSKIPFYIISGTLLGAVREKDFLGHDYDIDIGVNHEDLDMNALTSNVNSSNDFVITMINQLVTAKEDESGTLYSQLSKPILIKLCHKSGLHIDLFNHIIDGEVRWHGSPIHRWNNKEFTLATYSISGIEVQGPADYNTYLTENYGAWRTPKIDFNATLDTPNLIISNSTRGKTYFARAIRDLYQVNRDNDAKRLLDRSRLSIIQNRQEPTI